METLDSEVVKLTDLKELSYQLISVPRVFGQEIECLFKGLLQIKFSVASFEWNKTIVNHTQRGYSMETLY